MLAVTVVEQNETHVVTLKTELMNTMPDQEETSEYPTPADPASFTEGAAAQSRRGFELAALIFLVLISLAACAGVLWLVAQPPQTTAPQSVVPPLAKALEAPQKPPQEPAQPAQPSAPEGPPETSPAAPPPAVPPSAKTTEAPQAPQPETAQTPETPASEKQVEPPAGMPPPGARRISFPTDSSLGTLRVRQWGSDDEDAWTRLNEARGGVSVPAGMELRIDLYTSVAVDLSFLGTFADGTFQGLGLARTDTGDTDLAYLKSQADLVWVDLRGTRVTDKGLVHLEALPRLQRLNLRDTHVTEAGIGKLKQTLPHCRIVGP